MHLILTNTGEDIMSMWGGISAGLQDNGGVGISDPYSDTDNIGSSFSSLATSLIGAASNIGESYAISKVSGGQVYPTGNPLAPTMVIPSAQQQTQILQAQNAMQTSKLVEYGVIGLIAILVGVAIFK
jgi:hypothetical protein